MTKKSIFYVIVFIVILLLIGLFYFVKLGKEDNSLALFDEFNNNQIKFTEIAQAYVSDEGRLYEFCKLGVNEYKIGGFWFNSKDKKIKSNPAPASSEELDYEEFLQRTGITNERFDYYMNFINEFDSVKCIEGDINIKYGKDRGILFKSEYFPDKNGLIYITDGSITENINNQYINDNFKELIKIENTNWYKYRKFNE